MEKNHYYQGGLLDASDRWFWAVLVSPSKKKFVFELRQVAVAEGEPSACGSGCR